MADGAAGAAGDEAQDRGDERRGYAGPGLRWARHTSFQPPPTQSLIAPVPRPHSFAGATSFSNEVSLERYHGAIHRGSLRFWRLRQASARQVRPVSDYYQWWQEHCGEPPPYILAFVNSRSGNQSVSQAIKSQLLTLLERQFTNTGGGQVYLAGTVCELSEVAQNPFHVRDTITKTKRFVSRRSLRFLVCGGDGTVTWVLQEIEACRDANPEVFLDSELDPPIGIVPAGTGNDLARSLGWGPKLKRVADLVGYVQWVLSADAVPLDQWKVRLTFAQPPEHLPPVFRMVAPNYTSSSSSPGGASVAGAFACEGYFQNYFSVGMDASVTFGVEQARRSCCGKVCFRLGYGKICYACQAYRTGACLCCCARTLSIRGGRVQVQGTRQPHIDVDEVRQITLLNINSYGSGRVPFSAQDLLTVMPSDGKLEMFTVGNAARLGCIMGPECCLPEILARPSRVSFELAAGETFQMDGESWRLDVGCRVEVERNRQVQMLRPPTCPIGIWRGRQLPGFWHAAVAS